MPRTDYPDAIPLRTVAKNDNYYAITFLINNDFETTYWVQADTQTQAELIAWHKATQLAQQDFILQIYPI